MIDYKTQISSNPNVMGGKPVIKDTRITVELILRKLADGYTTNEIVQMYPQLTEENVLGSIAYAAAVIENEAVIDIDKAA